MNIFFVDQYQFAATAEKQMIQQAIAAIDDCEILTAETFDKAIGIGAEVGGCKSKRQAGCLYAACRCGTFQHYFRHQMDFQIVYYSNDDLKPALNNIITQLIKL